MHNSAWRGVPTSKKSVGFFLNMTTKADECKALLAEFATKAGLVRESACGKRKRADLEEVRSHLARLQALFDALKAHTGIGDLDELVKRLPELVAPKEANRAKEQKKEQHPTAESSFNRFLYTAAPAKFSFSFPPHIPLRFGEQFSSSDRCQLSIVGYMKQRPTFSILCVPTSMLHKPVPADAFKYYSTKYVMEQLGKNDTAMREARIRRYGPALNIYGSDMTADFKLNGETVRIHDIHAKGKRRIKMTSVGESRRSWYVNEAFFHTLERV